MAVAYWPYVTALQPSCGLDDKGVEKHSRLGFVLATQSITCGRSRLPYSGPDCVVAMVIEWKRETPSTK